MSARSCEPKCPSAWRQHRLENSEEFRVERAGRRLGFVEEVEWSDGGAPDSLVIESCTGGPTHIRVSSADVVVVDPSRCLVTLQTRARVTPAQRRPPARERT